MAEKLRQRQADIKNMKIGHFEISYKANPSVLSTDLAIIDFMYSD